MTLKLVLDRYEENIGVCLDFDDQRYLIPKEILGDMKVNDIFNIEFDGEAFSSPVLLVEETAKKKKKVEDQFWLWSYRFISYALYYFGDPGSTGINITKQNSQHLQLPFII